MAPQDSENCGRDFAKRKQTDADFAANSLLLRMVIIDIAINVLLSRVTRHPAGMHCPSWDDAFVSSFVFFFLLVTLRVRYLLTCRAFEGCIVRTRIALPFIGRFRRGLDRFCRKGLRFQTRYTVLTFVARWRHNFREIAVKNCENSKIRRKSLCAPLRFEKKFYRSSLGHGP